MKRTRVMTCGVFNFFFFFEFHRLDCLVDWFCLGYVIISKQLCIIIIIRFRFITPRGNGRERRRGAVTTHYWNNRKGRGGDARNCKRFLRKIIKATKKLTG